MNYTVQITEKFRKIVSAYSMLKTDSLLIGFSGGVDSTVLLHLLTKEFASPEKTLTALHINHMIRADEAERDEEFCRKFCLENGIAFECAKIDIPSLCRTLNLGTEECARIYRYKAFNEYCQKLNIKKIATAHNADDNFETVLFNLSRGCSLSGICGIPPVRDNIIRPLILCTKEEIIGYATENGIPFVFDSTNNDTDYTRNYIRHNIVPAFKKINSSVVSNVSRFTQNARKDSMFLDEISENYLEISDITTLSNLQTPILHRVISKKFEHTTNCKLETVHIEAVAALIASNKKNSSISLPCRMKAIIIGNDFIIKSEEQSENVTYSKDLSYGENAIVYDNSVVSLYSDSDNNKKYNLSIQNINKIFIHSTIDFDKIDGKLFVRNKQDGDAYKFGGFTRKLKKLFNDKKLSLNDRKTLPIICDCKGIVWVPGYGVRDDVACSEHTNNIYHLLYLKDQS